MEIVLKIFSGPNSTVLCSLSNNPENSEIPSPLTGGEGLGGGDHPPPNPLPSREGK